MTTDAPRRPYYELIGLRKNSASDGRSEFELPDNPNLGNSRGDVHGAAIFGLLDAACAEAARSSFPPGTGCATVSLTASFMEPGRGGLIARGQCCGPAAGSSRWKPRLATRRSPHRQGSRHGGGRSAAWQKLNGDAAVGMC